MKLALGLLAVAAVALVVAGIGDYDLDLTHAHRFAHSPHAKALLEDTQKAGISAEWFEQTLDHFAKAGSASEGATWKQRFYRDASRDSGDGPIFFYIGGEGPLNGPPGGTVADLAGIHGGLIVALEHRYYGESLPFPELTTEALAYHSSKQAIEDLAVFTTTFLAATYPGRPVFFVGGSYPGALASWIRVRHPELSVGSIASSGVVNAIDDFPAFDRQIATSAGPACASAIQALFHAIQNEVDAGGERRAALFARYDAEGFSDGDFYYLTADSAVMAIQYGAKPELCDRVTPYADDGPGLLDAFEAYLFEFMYATFGPAYIYDTRYQSNPVVTAKDNYRAWWWQKCTEFGWYQVAPADHAMRSYGLDRAYHDGHCKDLFGLDLAPPVEAINAYYGGDTPVAPYVFYSNGIMDPWQHASVLSPLGPDRPAHIWNCDPYCAHCVDLRGPEHDKTDAQTEGRALLYSYVEKWISAATADTPSLSSS